MTGVSGCGKSTVGARLATELGAPFVEGDSLHPPRNVASMAAGTPLTDDDRRDRRNWLDAVANPLAQAQDRGLVVSCSALKRSCLAERLQSRSVHYMLAPLLRSQLDTLEPPAADEHALTFEITRTADDIVLACREQLEAGA